MPVLGKDWHIELRQIGVAHLLQVFMVEPLAFFKVELCTALRAMLEREQADKLVHREDFLVVARIPSEKSEEIDHCLRKIARLAVA